MIFIIIEHRLPMVLLIQALKRQQEQQQKRLLTDAMFASFPLLFFLTSFAFDFVNCQRFLLSIVY